MDTLTGFANVQKERAGLFVDRLNEITANVTRGFEMVIANQVVLAQNINGLAHNMRLIAEKVGVEMQPPEENPEPALAGVDDDSNPGAN